MSTSYVFLGPTLSAAEATDLLPGAVVLPPVRHGDLFRIEPRAGDQVLIVDGFFLHTPPIRHKEILAALAAGAVVAGAGSMGALRAAELHRYGMRGVGTVFELYRDGVVEGDDEVAVVHAPAEDGYRQLSEPLVNIRMSLRAAVAASVLPAPDADRVLAAARALPFRARSARALARLAADGHPAAGAIGAFLRWHRTDDTDVKTADARELLHRAAAGTLAQHGPDDEPIRNVHTSIQRRWWLDHTRVGDAGISRLDCLLAVMLLHPEYPDLLRRSVLSSLTGLAPEDPELVRRAEWWVVDHGLLTSVDDGWVSAAERAESGPAGAALTAVVRAGAAWRLPEQSEPPFLDRADRPAVLATASRTVQLSRRINARLPMGVTGRRARFRPDVIDGSFARLWGCTEHQLRGRAQDRGFPELDLFRRHAEPFVALLKTGCLNTFPPLPAG
jgi:hypothetical protein